MKHYLKYFFIGHVSAPEKFKIKSLIFNLVVASVLLLLGFYLDEQYTTHLFSIVANAILILPIYFQYIKPRLNLFFN